jgi:CheY-like chemotaxis protein
MDVAAPMHIRPQDKPNLRAALSASESIDILYVTVDLREADYLDFALRKVAPNLHLDFTPGARPALNRLRSRRFDIVLIDNSIGLPDRAKLVAQIQGDDPAAAIVLIIGPAEKDPALPSLIAKADDHIVKGLNLVNELSDVLQHAFLRFQLGVRRRKPDPSDVAAFESRILPQIHGLERVAVITDEDPETTAATADGAADLRTSPRWEVNIDCRIIWHGSSYTACIHDLSEEGAFLETSPPPPVGSDIVLYFSVGSTNLRQEGIVMHDGWYLNAVRNFHGCGIRFKNPTEEVRAFCRNLGARSSKPALSKTMLEP